MMTNGKLGESILKHGKINKLVFAAQQRHLGLRWKYEN